MWLVYENEVKLTDSVRFVTERSMDGIPDHVWKEWERKRRHTFIGFLFLTFVMGLDMSAVFTTMYIYLKDLVKTDKPEMYYSLCLGGFNLTSLICCITLGRWLDNTRQVRLYSRIALVVQMIGYVLYTIHFHPAFVLVGRLFNGISDSFASIVSGELFRIYDPHDGVRANFWLTAAGFSGVLLGPGLSAVFKGVEGHIGTLTINYLNIPGVVLILLMIISLVLVTALVHDCSAEIDLKEHFKKLHREDVCNTDTETEENKQYAEEMCYFDYVKVESIPIKKVLKCFATEPDTLVIFSATFITMYSVYSACVILPIVIQGELKWGIRRISVIICAYGVLGLFLIILLGKFLSSSRTIYYISIFAILCQGSASFILPYLKNMKSNVYMDVVLLSIEICFLIVSWFFADTLLRVILSKMVPSRIQSFTECLRAGMTRTAIILASFLAPNIFPWLSESSLAACGAGIVILVAFIVRKSSLMEPKEISFDGYSVLPMMGVNDK